MPNYPDRQSPRLKWYDYRSAGRYVATICTRNRDHTFGEIRAGKMDVSEAGRIAHTFWYSLPVRFPGVELDAFALMPNHIHGIVVIPSKQFNIENMPERFRPSMHAQMEERHPEFHDYQPPTLGTIIRAYKAVVTYHIHQSGAKQYVWQSGYWSNILFTEAAFQHARRYIYENPSNWEKDTFYKA